MKNFQKKFSTRLVVLLAAISISIVSCTKDEEETEKVTTEEVAGIDISNQTFILPYSITLLNEEEQESYIQSIDQPTFDALIENARISEFLEGHIDDKNLWNQITEIFKDQDILTLGNVEKLLSQDQLKALSKYQLPEYNINENTGFGSKGCSKWKYKGKVERCAKFTLRGCQEYKICKKYTRSCNKWDLRYRTKYVC